MIRANPVIFIALILAIIGGVWWMMDWKYGAVITNKDSEIALLKGQRDDYRDKLSGATPDQAKARIDALEGRLARLEPRRLTEQQRANLTARLRLPAGADYSIAISRDLSCADCVQLAADISAAFGSSTGWHVSNPGEMGVSNMPPHGIAVRCANIASPSPEARIVIDALHAIGIQFDLQNDGSLQRSEAFPKVPPVKILLTTRITN